MKILLIGLLSLTTFSSFAGLKDIKGGAYDVIEVDPSGHCGDLNYARNTKKMNIKVTDTTLSIPMYDFKNAQLDKTARSKVTKHKSSSLELTARSTVTLTESEDAVNVSMHGMYSRTLKAKTIDALDTLYIYTIGNLVHYYGSGQDQRIDQQAFDYSLVITSESDNVITIEYLNHRNLRETNTCKFEKSITGV